MSQLISNQKLDGLYFCLAIKSKSKFSQAIATRERRAIRKEPTCYSIEHLLDPITGSQAHERTVTPVFNLHVGDSFDRNDDEFEDQIL